MIAGTRSSASAVAAGATTTTAITTRSPLHVLGLDPGSRFTGWGVVAVDGARSRYLGCGRIALPAGEPLPLRLGRLAAEVEALLGRWRPAAAVLEEPFHGVNSRSLIVLAQARGAILATLARAAVPIDEYSPAEVKMAVTGSGRAEKQQVARMVAMLLPGSGGAVADAADALAVALTWAARRPLERAAAVAVNR
jgi:crossover junction endodeoxyribonuclease RuvC